MMRLSSLSLSFFCFFLLALLLPASAQTVGELKFVMLLHRHGDRSYFIPPPQISAAKLAEEWPFGLGELTPHGMLQAYEYGQAFRAKYIDSAEGQRLVPGGIFNPKIHYVQSTNIHRTMQTAQSMLYGMYYQKGPKDSLTNSSLPNSFQPVEVSTILSPLHTDYLLLGFDWTNNNCNGNAEFEKMVQSPFWVQKAADNKAVLQAISTAMYNTVSLDMDISVPYSNDWLVCDSVHGYLSTNWPLMNATLVQTMGDLTKWVTNNYNDLPIITKQLMAGRMVGELIRNIDMVIANDTNALKILHWSAHDTTVLSLLLAFEMFDGTPPPYVSHVNVELRQSTTTPKNYNVIVLYQDVAMPQPWCENKMVCSYAIFKSHFENTGFAYMQDGDILSLCDKATGRTSTANPWTTAETALATSLALSLSACAVLAFFLVKAREALFLSTSTSAYNEVEEATM